ncbi:MAG: DoxX family protein [Burkholderiales bacterium]
MSSIPAPRGAALVPWAARLYRPLEPFAYTLIRAATGAIFIPHGVQKLFLGGAMSATAMGLGVLELVGGPLIAFGVLVRPLALLLIIDVLMVIAANIGKGWLWTRGGVQYHSFLLGMCLALLIGGSGRHVIAHWPGSRFEEAWKSLNRVLVPIAYALARVWFALLILPSGYEKVFANGAARIAAGNILKTGFYPPMFWAWVVAVLESVGMILLALGLGTRLVAFLMAIELGVIVVAIQAPNGYYWTSRGAEFALVLFVVCLAFVIGGGGRYSLDRKLGREF